MEAYLYTIIVYGCGSEDGALAENGSYVCVYGRVDGVKGADTFEVLCMPSRIVDNKQ